VRKKAVGGEKDIDGRNRMPRILHVLQSNLPFNKNFDYSLSLIQLLLRPLAWVDGPLISQAVLLLCAPTKDYHLRRLKQDGKIYKER
jgi:hypothetical protein